MLSQYQTSHQLIELFPNHVIDRMDYDSTMKKGSYKALMNRFSNLETHILIGTCYGDPCLLNRVEKYIETIIPIDY